MSKFASQVPYLVIVGLVALVAVASLVLNNGAGVEGAAVVYETSENQRVTGCMDTDEEGNIYSKGKVQLGVTIREDYCSTDRITLHQWYCKNSEQARESRPQRCAKGCVSGVCLK